MMKSVASWRHDTLRKYYAASCKLESFEKMNIEPRTKETYSYE
jgi:hypothetical protein